MFFWNGKGQWGGNLYFSINNFDILPGHLCTGE